MADDKFPVLDATALDATRQALHAYSKVAGAWAKVTRKKRKHWWHASLRPSLYGMTTGVLYGDTDFEIDHYQPILYVLDSFEQLRDAMVTYAEQILEEVGRLDELETISG